MYPLVLSELMTYIVESNLCSDDPVTFRLADICHLYQQRLEQLGVESPSVNSTRLKDKLLAEIPELEAHKSGRDVLLAFQKDVGKALAQSSDLSEAVIIAKAANILRKSILDHQSRFDGTFSEPCVRNSVPPLLLQFVGMLEHGADIKSRYDLEHQSQTRPLHSSCSSTATPDTKRKQQLIDTPKTEKHHSQSTWDSQSMPKPGRETWLKCYISMASVSLMTEYWRSLHS